MRGYRVRSSAIVVAACFVILAALVATHVTEGLDTAVYDRLTPVGSWNHTHQVASDIPDYAAPKRQVFVFGLFVLALVAWRRSLTPVVVAVLLVGVAAFPELAVKRLILRTDTGGHVTNAGSFPSGHMAITVAIVGGVLLLLVGRTRWWQWVPLSLPPLAIAACLLYGGVHWTTDVIGGALLGVVAITVAAAVPDRAGVRTPARTEPAPAPAP